MKEPIKIAFYGKGGIGKSTIASNVAAAMGSLGLKVLFIGCDPKGDSVKNITGGKIRPMINLILEQGEALREEEFLKKGYLGISCIETGGPSPGVGCAGRGIITMTEELYKHEIFEKDWDVIIYDVLGDVVCGGFAVPMRDGYVDCVFLVSSDEYMSIYAANNILKSVKVFSDDKEPFLGGIIYNHRSSTPVGGLIQSFANQTKIPIVSEIRYAREIVLSDLGHKTVIEGYPDSSASAEFVSIAEKIIAGLVKTVPEPLEDNELEKLAQEYLKQIAGAV